MATLIIPEALADVRAVIVERLEALPDEQRDNLERELDLGWDERFAWQTAQSQAHAAGRITLDVAQYLYQGIGESAGTSNGGWPLGVELADKVLITTAIGSLVAAGRVDIAV